MDTRPRRTYLNERPRRNRNTAGIRALARENFVRVDKLIEPLFLIDGNSRAEPISSMPGINRLSEDKALSHIEKSLGLGICSFILFPAVDDALKDKHASYSYRSDCFYLRVIRAIKQRFPEAVLISDVALDPYSSDGHDGIVRDGKILNDETLEVLGKMSLAQAEAGIDIIGPSDMMDGRVGFLREALDTAGFTETGIMSYTAKYASAFYGPFRDALASAPKFGDKKTYQMDPANAAEALREARLDAAEGADFLMVKPALAYLDIIHRVKEATDLPVVCYNVSGEYAMVKAAAEKGWLDGDKARDEMLLGFFRAGADAVISYFAHEFAAHRAAIS
ncbi:porphobilinogen synthase [Turneriella parva]|uniref:Delta-aminolevulinic acid dehydratase n=1 Tax=Turneriella parva (strain ATCC BAA-1111 / DSM 21527 / NCTC 11395 / H) TaxID=869212 RepID=I4B7X4_TURPD|nr:porphobilinogen synthase [Turneriella parva]AFM13381.1 delta-aminolevulinic acid dehydratase [Turneriella parva DSM 21527]